MTTNLSIVKTILDSNDSGNEFVSDAQIAVISWFIANDGFRVAGLTLPDPVREALFTLKDFIKRPEKYPADEVQEDSAA